MAISEIVNKTEDNVFRKHIRDLMENSPTSKDNEQSFEDIPNISRMNDDEEVAKLNHKLVRFDCIISDMFEEEIFVSVIDTATNSQSQDSKFIYKYFTEIDN